MPLERVSRTVAALALLSFVASSPGRAAEPLPLPTVPRFAIAPSPIGLRGDVRPRQYLGVVGPRSAWLGVETGEAELWVHPLKLASGFSLGFRVPEYAEPVRGADVARTVEVRPEATTITYSPRHVHRAPARARAARRAGPARPAGGGRVPAARDRRELPDRAAVRLARRPRRAVRVLERRRPGVRPLGEPAAEERLHRVALGRVRLEPPRPRPARRAQHLHDPGRPRAGARGRWCRSRSWPGRGRARRRRRPTGGSSSRAAELYAARRRHADALREEGLRIDTPDDRLDLALEWAKVNLDEQTVCNPDLGCGLVAGWGPSGDGARPGFGWFFGGDAAINSLAMAATGQWAPGRGRSALPREVPARGREDPARDLAGGRRRPVVHGLPVRLLPRRHDALLAARALAALEGDGRRGAPRRAVAGGEEGVGLVPADTTPTATGSSRTPPAAWARSRSGRSARTSTRTSTSPRSGRAAAGAMAEMAAARGEDDARRRGAAPSRRKARGLDRVALLDRGGGAPRLRRPAVGEDQRHADRVAGDRRRLRPLRARPRPKDARGAVGDTPSPRTGARACSRPRARSTTRPTTTWARCGPSSPASSRSATTSTTGRGPAYPLVDALARMAFDWARGRHPELLSGAYYRPLDTAVPHQFFATSMLVSPIAYGLLGWEPDAPAGRARLAPQLPPQWEKVRVSGLRAGAARLDAAIEQGPGRLSLRLEPRAGRLSVDVRPHLPPGARDVAATLDGARRVVARRRRRGGPRRRPAGPRDPLAGRPGRRAAARGPRAGAGRPGRARPRLRERCGRLAPRARGAGRHLRRRAPARRGAVVRRGRDAADRRAR